jgi:hypothetical protein
MDYVYQLYKNVKKFQDFIDINIQYFNGEVDELLTTSVAFNDNYDTYINSRDVLIELSNKKILYCCGNPSISISNDEQIVKQRSDIYFLVNVDLANLLKNYLFLDDRIYVSMYYPDGHCIDNIPNNSETVPLSFLNDEVLTSWLRNHNRFSNSKAYIDLDDIDNIFNKLVECSIISVNFDEDEPVENILLSYINMIQ